MRTCCIAQGMLLLWKGLYHETKILELSFCISPSSEYSGLISFKIDWFDLLAVKGLSSVFSSTTVQRHQFLVLCLLSGPALRTVHHHQEDHSLDYTDLCQQSDVSAFQHCLCLS